VTVADRGAERAQLVLLAAVVVAVALAPVVLAYLQLGAHPDAGVDDENYGTDARRFLERATHAAGTEATGADWTDRERVVERGPAPVALGSPDRRRSGRRGSARNVERRLEAW